MMKGEILGGNKPLISYQSLSLKYLYSNTPSEHDVSQKKEVTNGASFFFFKFLGKYIFWLSGYLCFEVAAVIMCVYYDK